MKNGKQNRLISDILVIAIGIVVILGLIFLYVNNRKLSSDAENLEDKVELYKERSENSKSKLDEAQKQIIKIKRDSDYDDYNKKTKKEKLEDAKDMKEKIEKEANKDSTIEEYIEKQERKKDSPSASSVPKAGDQESLDRARKSQANLPVNPTEPARNPLIDSPVLSSESGGVTTPTEPGTSAPGQSDGGALLTDPNVNVNPNPDPSVPGGIGGGTTEGNNGSIDGGGDTGTPPVEPNPIEPGVPVVPTDPDVNVNPNPDPSTPGGIGGGGNGNVDTGNTGGTDNGSGGVDTGGSNNNGGNTIDPTPPVTVPEDPDVNINPNPDPNTPGGIGGGGNGGTLEPTPEPEPKPEPEEPSVNPDPEEPSVEPTPEPEEPSVEPEEPDDGEDTNTPSEEEDNEGEVQPPSEDVEQQQPVDEVPQEPIDENAEEITQ